MLLTAPAAVLNAVSGACSFLPSADPLEPSPDQAREWLREELSKAEYQPGLVDRLLRWLREVISQGGPGGSASMSPWLILVLAVAVILLVVLVLRMSRRTPAPLAATVEHHIEVSPQRYREQGEQAFAQGQYGQAAIEWFRCLASLLTQRSFLPGATVATSADVARAVSRHSSGQAQSAVLAATIFDRARYDTHPIARGDAARVREVCDALLDALSKDEQAQASSASAEGGART